MNIVTRKLAYFILGLGLPLATLQPAYADDIEIFSVGSAVTPKILMILDTSLSMADPVSNNENRLTHMKRAMKSFIESAEGVHVGIMRFNTRTGAMVYPVSNLTAQVNETISSLNRPLTANKNHAYQSKTGRLNIETVDWQSSMSLSSEGKIGMRFTNIVIPQGHVITKAYLELIPTSSSCKSYTYDDYDRDWTTDSNCKIKFTVHGDKTPNSVDFYTKDMSISSRPPTTKITAHQITTWQQSVSNNTSVVVNGLALIIKEIIDQDGWKKGNALSLIIDTKKTDNYLSTTGFNIHNVIAGFAPTLFIEFTPYERTISVKDKMLEALENQKMTNYTPIVPALFEAVKYFQGANIDSSHNTGISRTRSAPNSTIINKLHERVAHPQSFNNGSTIYPPGCNVGNLNSTQCRNISIESTARYISPLTSTCNDDEAAIVLLTDGDATLYNGGTWWSNMRTDIRTLTGGSCTSSPSAQACGVRLATKMAQGILVNNAAKKISLHTIGFNTANDFLDDLAQQGEPAPAVPSRYHSATNSDQLLTVFNEIKNSVLTDTSTFANSAASVSTSNRLRHNDTLYFALFAPGDQSLWAGNLKRYQLHANGEIYDNSNPQQPATDDAGIFIDSAKSFWSSTADGSNVAQGGAVSVLANNSSRNIYINAGTSSALTKLANTTTVKDALTPSVFNVSDTTEAEALIEWMLSNKTIADPLHSTPTEISYSNKNPVIFFGDNQGYLHAIDSATGSELYAFMPQELLSNQQHVKANLASVNGNHIYGMDGEIVQWQKSDGTKYIYSGMRRGGSSYYALDVTTRDTPSLKWKIDPSSSGFSRLGQTWSKPVKTKIVLSGTTRDVLIFGGGYDPAQDNSNTRTADNKGVGVYIVDADDGELLWSATAANSSNPAMKYSIPSDVKAIDIDGDGAVDQIYVGDMGGQLWRFDVTNKSGSNAITYDVIANIAIDASAANNRRFYHAPDVSVMKGHGGQVLAVAIGSGYRAHPNNGVIQDKFYMFKQPLKIEGSYPSLIVQSDLFDATSNTIGQGSDGAVNIASNALNNADGWYLTLSSGGEKVLASSLTVDHAIWFTTFQPSLTTAGCADRKGTSRLYRVGVSDATPDYRKVVPQDPDQAKLDSANKCRSVSCNISDRSMILRNTTLPPRPALLNIGGKRLIGVGSEYYPALNNKTTNMYWSNSQ